jgi:Protein of unknown function (DUF2034)
MMIHHPPRCRPLIGAFTLANKLLSCSYQPFRTISSTTSSTQDHDSLQTFLAYADRVDLNRSSTVFTGTYYEYSVLNALRRLGFSLTRTGGRGDFGIDLMGHWSLPSPDTSSPSDDRKIPVIVQCKNLARPPGPNLVRELEGAFPGAPAALGLESSILGILATPLPATKGVRDGLGRSKLPLAFLNVTMDDRDEVTGIGRIEQLVWNGIAGRQLLGGIGVTVRYAPAVAGEDLTKEVCLTLKGEVVEDHIFDEIAKTNK